jgi:hypothetical protein|eukprot:COSAG06_NODE_1132_length_10582_cov_5.539826_7_plen_113_part_00
MLRSFGVDKSMRAFFGLVPPNSLADAHPPQTTSRHPHAVHEAPDMTRATMSPYRPRASAKMRMRIIPTKSFGCCEVQRTPASPTMPIAPPAARPLKPTATPEPKCAKPSFAQ